MKQLKIIRSKKPMHRQARFIQDENGEWIGKVYGHDGQDADGNARLFVAAPKLLKALQDSLWYLHDCPEELRAAKEAIAEALGKEASDIHVEA